MSNNGRLTWTNDKRLLSDLIPWPRNPRQVKVDQVKRLQESLTEFGQPETIAIGPGNELYNGHQRLKSWADEFGDIEVDVRISNRPLTEKEREKLTIFLHKGAAGEWDFDTLANEFEVDDLLDWGFDEHELDLDMWGVESDEDPGAQIDRAEELREMWGVESGQLWRLGEHRLICGDCTDAEVVSQLMQGEKAGAVVTDPPYGIEREGIPNDDPEGLRELYDGCLAVMPITDAVIIAFQSPRLEWVWLDAARDAEHKPERLLWMNKPNDANTFPWHGWLMVGEVIRITSFGKPRWGEPREFVHDCFTVQLGLQKDVEGLHTTPKPPEVVGNLTENTLGLVYDPFLGSGTTLIACERLGRKCRAVEISPAYCAVAIQRWVDMTGGEPELVE